MLKTEAAYVAKRPQEAVALLIVIDGDEVGLSGRLKEVDIELRDVEVSPERIGVCVPCRNVETWLLWLNGAHDLNEQEDFKPRSLRELRNVPKKRFVDAWFSTLTEDERREEQERLPALVHAKQEVARLRKSLTQ